MEAPDALEPRLREGEEAEADAEGNAAGADSDPNPEEQQQQQRQQQEAPGDVDGAGGAGAGLVGVNAAAAVAVEVFNQDPEDQQPAARALNAGAVAGPPMVPPTPAVAAPGPNIAPWPGEGAAAAAAAGPGVVVGPGIGRPRLQPLLFRRASISSLDESSQKYDEPPKFGCFPMVSTAADSGRPSYRNPSHPSRALDVLHQMRRSALLTDVVLSAGGVDLCAHKNVLAACSPYFYAMFTGFTEKTMDRVTLMDIDPDALVTLVDYAYTAKVEVNEDNVQTLLQAANLLQLVDVTEACCQFLQSQLHPTNCLGIRAFADLHGCQELMSQAEKYAETHFAEVLDCDEFLALEVSQVAELISSDTITVPSEEKVYESVLAWVRHDEESRRCHLPVLMEHVRLPLLSREYIFQRVDGEALFESQPRCKDFIIEALKYHLASGDPAKLAYFNGSDRTKPRQPIGLPKVMLAIGGQAPKAIRNVECYDFKEERWFQVTDMDSRRCRCGVAVVRGKVYAVGGFNGALRVRTVDEYDPVKDKWSSVASMDARRSTLGVAVLNDKIYAVGGFDGSTGLNSAEVSGSAL